MSGSCRVTVEKNKEVGTLNTLDVFGEAALFHSNGIRSANVIAKEDLEVLMLKQNDLQLLIQSGDLNEHCVQALKEVSTKRLERNHKG